jgi:hypothetical protein
MDGVAALSALKDPLFQFLEQGHQVFLLENIRFLCHLHD